MTNPGKERMTFVDDYRWDQVETHERPRELPILKVQVTAEHLLGHMGISKPIAEDEVVIMCTANPKKSEIILNLNLS